MLLFPLRQRFPAPSPINRATTMAADRSGESFIEALKRGHPGAAQRMWEEFVDPLLRVARRRLRAMRVPDASACVQDAMKSIFEGIKRDAYPRLNDRDDLWRLLAVITARKANHHIRDEMREKRGAGKVIGEADLNAGHDKDFDGLAQFFGTQPTPAFEVQWAEEFELRLMELQPEYQDVALARMAGYSNAEVAEQLGVVVRTVERRLSYIRRVWRDDGIVGDDH